MELNSNIGLILINKYTPAVTMVELCNKALTLVGPSFALANQGVNGINALLADAAKIIHIVNRNIKSPFLYITKL